MGFKRMVSKMSYFFQGGIFRSRRPVLYFLVLITAIVIFLPYFFKQRHNKLHSKLVQDSRKMIAKKPSRALKFSGSNFILNGKPFTILSGSIHYFRVPVAYWSDRLVKLKAMGLNTVETYVPWNLHEEIKGTMKVEGNLDIVSFIKEAHKLGLYVIIRPGPYICAEWDLGGLPSWLLHDSNQKLRSSYPPFLNAVEKYFNKLLPLIVPFEIMLKNGIKELMITSDSIQAFKNNPHNLTGVLKTINLNSNEVTSLEELKKLQPNKPLMVTEFWPGWFDHWGEHHHIMSHDQVANRVTNILKMGASINFYMFHGGTNFGFMNGANLQGDEGYLPTITSYDYDALLSEAGDITPKYKVLKEVLKTYAPNSSLPEVYPTLPVPIKKKAYDPLHMNEYVPLIDTYKFVDQTVKSKTVLPMEGLLINNNGGQPYGFIVYRTKLPKGSKVLEIEKYRDRAQVMVGSQLVGTLDAFDMNKKYMAIEKMSHVKLELKYKPLDKNEETIYLDIIVENMGRNNFGNHLNDQRKGILGEVLIDGKKPESWTIFPLSFHSLFVRRVFHEAKWQTMPLSADQSILYPAFFKVVFNIDSQPHDTFLLMEGWGKGVVFVNGRILGRYWKIGPQKTLYLPSPWLTVGENIIVIFELETRSKDGLLTFTSKPNLGKTA
ncbi:beta-galactosidase-1-like protein 2 isoform X2 [Actinia tenebrosa]|uniref:Beta-galactosidase-1-like protein 2 isoform X2 n=1 Tax=Actinia tenebrosa TaxID=6105 RepID=A0A6P8IBI1_ACTTE|nr:beta-galactosidase-1-like protein 2 isoform X2 [Actinia tenebrosa]